MLRHVSLAIRSFQKKKEVKRTLTGFEQWKSEIRQLPKAIVKGKKLLLIRLDDIGDYLLFRNTLVTYKQSPRWEGYEITLLGLEVWKPFFETADTATVDKTIWIKKHDFFAKPELFTELFQKLRSEGYSAVVCPSRVRPLLLDDLFMLAAGAPLNIGCCNDFAHREINEASDQLYQELFKEPVLCHEFLFNKAFAEWCNRVALPISRMHYPAPALPGPHDPPYVICFVGASVKSRRWTPERWIDFVQLCQREGRFHPILAGGKGDLSVADPIVAATGVESIVGKVSLSEMTNWISHAQAVVTNDTMASHLSVSLSRPVVVIASGDNFFKFSDYAEAGITGVATVYPAAFLKEWKQKQFQNFKHYVAVSNDMASIPAVEVYEALKAIMDKNPGAAPGSPVQPVNGC